MSANNQLDALTGMRGISALMVIFTHCYSNGAERFGIPPAFTIAGEVSVYFFFVLSGFLLTYRAYCEILPAPKKPNPSEGAIAETPRIVSTEKALPNPTLVMPTKTSVLFYFFRRLFRIYPSYLLTLLLLEDANYPRVTLRVVKRFFMLNTEYAHLWTVRVELAYYSLIPLFQILTAIAMKLENKYSKTRRIPFHLLTVAGITGIAIWLNCIEKLEVPYPTDRTVPFHANFSVFWYGSLAGTAYFYLKKHGYIFKKPKGRKQTLIFYGIELLTYMVVVCIIFTNRFSSVAFIGRETWLCNTSVASITPLYGLLLILIAITEGQTSMGRFFTCNFFTWSGKCSYSIYLLHYGAINFITGTDVKGFEAVLAATVLACLIGWVVHTLVEEPGVKVGNYLIKKIRAYQTARAKMARSNKIAEAPVEIEIVTKDPKTPATADNISDKSPLSSGPTVAEKVLSIGSPKSSSSEVEKDNEALINKDSKDVNNDANLILNSNKPNLIEVVA